jgi:hypothetical protein
VTRRAPPLCPLCGEESYFRNHLYHKHCVAKAKGCTCVWEQGIPGVWSRLPVAGCPFHVEG